jgi:hypothetical protein
MSNIEHSTQLPPALRALLTSRSIVKLGLHVKQSLLDIANSFHDPELSSDLKSNPSFVDLAQHARLKGVVSNALSSLEALAGSVLKKSVAPITESQISWPPQYISDLHQHVDCVWQIYHTLSSLDSVGLPLLDSQAQYSGFPVTIFHAEKAVAEGVIVWPQPASIEVTDTEDGTKRRLNITRTRSLVTLTQILLPNSIHRLHSQTMDWIYTHGRQIVVTTTTLRSRGSSNQLPASAADYAFATPAAFTPLDESEIAPFVPSIVNGSHHIIQDDDPGVENDLGAEDAEVDLEDLVEPEDALLDELFLGEEVCFKLINVTILTNVAERGKY